MSLDHLKFTKTHEWFRLEGKKGTIGISQHAQEEISDVVFVELPTIGRVIKQGEEAAVVESVKSAFSIYAPASGTILQVNDALTKDPGLINRSPYESGWIFTIDVTNPQEVENLMDSAAYEGWSTGKH